MKQLNEIKRMQQLAGILIESQLNQGQKTTDVLKEYAIADRALDAGAFKEINPDTEVKLGNRILVKTVGNYFMTVIKINGAPLDPKTVYTLEYDDDSTTKKVTRQELQDKYIVGVDGWKDPEEEDENQDDEDPLYNQLANEIGEKKLQKLLMKGWEIDDIAEDPQGAAASIK